jgi:hypothetical protein
MQMVQKIRKEIHHILAISKWYDKSERKFTLHYIGYKQMVPQIRKETPFILIMDANGPKNPKGNSLYIGYKQRVRKIRKEIHFTGYSL